MGVIGRLEGMGNGLRVVVVSTTARNLCEGIAGNF